MRDRSSSSAFAFTRLSNLDQGNGRRGMKVMGLGPWALVLGSWSVLRPERGTRDSGGGTDGGPRAKDQSLVADEAGEVALGALAPPHLFVDLHQTGARYQALCDLICQHLGLQKRMVSEYPDVPEFVRDCRLELFLCQLADKVLFH